MNTYPEMNSKIVGLLRATDDNPVMLYAAARIEELESELAHAQRLENELTEAQRMAASCHVLIQKSIALLGYGEDASGIDKEEFLSELRMQNEKVCEWATK